MGLNLSGRSIFEIINSLPNKTPPGVIFEPALPYRLVHPLVWGTIISPAPGYQPTQLAPPPSGCFKLGPWWRLYLGGEVFSFEHSCEFWYLDTATSLLSEFQEAQQSKQLKKLSLEDLRPEGTLSKASVWALHFSSNNEKNTPMSKCLPTLSRIAIGLCKVICSSWPEAENSNLGK